LEEVGLAIKNISLHDQLAANHEMMTDIFRQLSSACVVISRDLTILHANKAARVLFSRPTRRQGELEFADLPQALGSKVYQVLRTGTAIATFQYQPPESMARTYKVTILPFQKQEAAAASSALLVAEDHTHTHHIQRLEVEAANLRLVRTMADRLAHEIGNALVPISTHQQLLAQGYQDPEFRASLNVAVSDGVKRISRLSSQMRYLARESIPSVEAFPLEPLVQEAFDEAKRHQPVRASRLNFDAPSPTPVLEGDRPSLRHALTEIFINALQANVIDAKVGVRVLTEGAGTPAGDITIEIQDNGPGFSPELLEKALEPFFTSRNVGLGLGLAVAKKIVETHGGKLSLANSADSHSGIVRINFPLRQSSQNNG
jgi:nitrogen fixation/metabolism regulation signal transduction histidine kinase